MYRCPLPGCGGAVLNQQSVRRALLPHCRIYHQTADALRYTFHIEAKRGPEVLLFPPSNEPEIRGEGAGELGGDTPAEPTTLDFDLTPLTQSNSAAESEVITGESIHTIGGLPSKRAVIDIDTQPTQSNQDISTPSLRKDDINFENEQSTVLPVSQNTDAVVPKVSTGFKGMGVHKLNFSAKNGPTTSEYATPIAHYAKRKRGPEVVAPNKMLQRESDIEVPAAVCPHNPLTKLTLSADLPELRGGPSIDASTTSSDITLGNKFVSGGHLCTVPKN